LLSRLLDAIKFDPMTTIRRTAVLAAVALVSLLALAPVAMAADGEGLYGRTNDKVITFFSFGVIAFFAILVIGLSILQHRLESRKERVREDIERLRQP
jgi:putative copper export protein